MAFRFRLAPVLHHRQRVEDAAALDLARAQQSLESISRQLAQARDKMEACTRAVAAAAARGTTGMELGYLAHGVETLTRRWTLTAAELGAQRERTEQARTSLVEAARSRQVLERLGESQRVAHVRWLDAVERREADDVTAANFFWRRAQSPAELEAAQ
jgi:flagellar export protein FliJ